VRIEQLDQLGEIRKRPGQAVNFIDDDDVDLTGPDLFKKSLRRWPVGIATRKAAIVVFGSQ
jgi:hypothetical protein